MLHSLTLCLVISNLESAGYSSMTAVQMQVIPAALSRNDLLVCAGTGSGKSESCRVVIQDRLHSSLLFSPFSALSFLLPIILLLLGREEGMGEAADSGTVTRSPQCLILVPTRELAMQIENQAKQLMRGTREEIKLRNVMV